MIFSPHKIITQTEFDWDLAASGIA